MRLIIALLVSGVCFGQGWQELSNTHFQSVSTPNNFTSTYMGHTMPVTQFADEHHRILDQWGSAWADTKRNRLCFYGGGHNGPNDNSIECLDLQTVSSTTATCGGQTCITTSNTGSAPAMTRINDPSVYQTACPQPANYDGTPLSMQNWGGLVYLPKSDKYFSVSNATQCPDNYHQTWMFDPTNGTWAAKATAPDDQDAGKECALDPTTVNESVICLITNTILYRYDVVADTWTSMSNGSWTIRNGAAVVIDPDRKIFFSIGPNFDASSPAMFAIGIGTPTVATDWTSTVTGCADLMAYPYASLAWDPSIHRIVGYVPMTAAVPGTAANRIVIFDPGTRTCVTQPQLGGTGPLTTSAGALSNQGTQLHWSYFPALKEYVLVNDDNLNAYTFKLNLTPVPGQGGSTLTCLDRDSDGYGVGSGCTGPDADDLDSGVHTSAQFTTKWTDIPTGLKHLGYSPANIFYISTGGSDAGSPANCKNTVGSPCATAAYVYAHGFAAGDMILFRSGTYHEFVSPTTGTAGNPTMAMSYPGELATFTSAAAAADGIDFTESQIYSVVDGFYINGSGAANGCILGAENTNIIMRHIETNACGVWGIDFQGDTTGTSGCSNCRPLDDITISDSVLHESGGQHGAYFSSHEAALSTNIFWYLDISYGHPWNGFHTTGQFSNLVMSQDWTYNNGLSGYSWQNGTSNSFLQESVSLNDNQSMDIDLYDGSGNPDCPNGAPYPLGTVCPFAQNNNTIENNTFYLTGTDSTGTSNGHTYALTFGRQIAGCVTATCLAQVMTGNIFRNNVMVTNNADGGNFASGNTYPPMQFANSTGTTYINQTTFANNLAFDAANSGMVVGYGPGNSFGYAPYSCATLGSVAAASTGCLNVTPQFTAGCTYNTLGACNLKPLVSSPAVGAGTPPQYPRYDLLGNAISETAPTLGAFAVTGAGSSGTGISGKVTIGGNVVIQ